LQATDADVVFDSDRGSSERRRVCFPRFDFLVNRVSSFQRTGAIDFEKGVEFIVQSFGGRDGRLHSGAGGQAAVADLISKCRYGFVHDKEPSLAVGLVPRLRQYFRNAKVSRRWIWRLIEREFCPSDGCTSSGAMIRCVHHPASDRRARARIH